MTPPMTDKMPPPEPTTIFTAISDCIDWVPHAEAIAYGAACAAAERERAAKMCELESVVMATRDQTRGAMWCAAAIRAMSAQPEP